MEHARRGIRAERGFAHVGVIVGIIAGSLALIGILSFVPLGGAAGYNVAVNVSYLDVSAIVVSDYQITSVTASTTGASPLINWGNSLSIAPFAVTGTYVSKACVGGQCATLSSSHLFPTVPFINGQSLTASDTFHIGGVPAGEQPISVTLSVNGQQVATGSGSICVNGGC